MKILLLMQHDVYHGREYMDAMIKNKINFDVISISNKKNSFINNVEDKRTNFLWKPEKFEKMIDKVKNYYEFKSLTDHKFIKFSPRRFALI